MSMSAEASAVEAFAEFVAAAEPRLRQALVSAYGTEVGREAAAEALLYGWENWDRVGRMDSPVGYLYRVGQTKSKRLRARPLTYPAVPPRQMPWIEPGLPDALTNLTDRQRVVVLLIHSYEWTYGEVADVLGVSLNTVRKHMTRAMAKLRASLEVDVGA